MCLIFKHMEHSITSYRNSNIPTCGKENDLTDQFLFFVPQSAGLSFHILKCFQISFLRHYILDQEI